TVSSRAGDSDGSTGGAGALCPSIAGQPSLLALMSNLKWTAASSDPLGFCGLKAKSPLAKAMLTFSELLSPPLGSVSATLVTVTWFMLMMRNPCWLWPAVQWVIVASLICTPVGQACSGFGDALSMP